MTFMSVTQGALLFADNFFCIIKSELADNNKCISVFT